MEGLLLRPHVNRSFCCRREPISRAPFAFNTCLSSRTRHSSHFAFFYYLLRCSLGKHQSKPLLSSAAFKEGDGLAEQDSSLHAEEDDGSARVESVKVEEDRNTDKDDESAIVASAKQNKDIFFIWNGAKPLPLAFSLGIGLAVYIFLPVPEALSPQAWQMLAIFLTTIMGLVSSPVPVGAWAFLALTVSIATGTLPFSAAFSAFTNEVIWLIVISFFFARGFVKTGLGDRIATLFVKMMGGSTLGLSYGLTISEALIAPAMPSTTARAAGVFLPVIQSLSLSAGSKPKDASSKKLGSFLVQCQFQAAGHSSALFLTAAAQNLLCIKLAEELGVVFSNPWVEWFEAASVPGIVALLANPLILYKLSPPEIRDTPDAPALAARKLQEMGPIKQDEWIMIATMLFAVALWIFGDQIGITSVVTAMLGLSTLLLLGVIDWDDCLNEKAAWDTLVWFAVLVGMASQLTSLGIVQWLADVVDGVLLSLSLGWPVAFVILQASYFIIHYLFASQTAHVGALYSAFLAMHIAAGVPSVLAALALAYNTSLFGGLAHYSSGQAAVYYGAGYVELPEIFRTGFICGVLNCLLWGTVGVGWWKFLGLY